MAPHKSSLFSSPILFSREAPEQGGLLSGIDPTVVNTTDPLRLWIIQLAVIIGTAQFLGFFLRRIRQPRVIAEVIGGIVLGPSIMGRIPHFTEHIFPAASIPFLSLTANIGLVFFLFLVGLEIDLNSIRNNARTSLIISLGGMILPFSIGAGMAKLIFDKYVEPVTPGTNFSHFMLFCCVAYSITAFPVLCRVLTELKLLDTTVGVCVLSAGVGNDIVGWTLLALSVALVNASSGITALYIVLLAVGWAIFLLVPVKWVWKRFAKMTCREGDGPSLLFMTGTMLLMFGSAWFTDVIGVHAIFGGFLVGLVIPREGGLAISIMEKMEDIVAIVFLPLYFFLSGLSTNLGLLNTGEIWGYTIAIICTAWVGKFVGASVGARVAGSGGGGVGTGWRECSAVGILMSCKGLVELIVLNVGLSAGILSPQVFSMFVLEALTLTFGTTPAVLAVYPARVRVRAYGGGGQLHAPHPKKKDDDEEKETREHIGGARKRRYTIVLDRLEHLSAMVVMSRLLLQPTTPQPQTTTTLNLHKLTSTTSTTTMTTDSLDPSRKPDSEPEQKPEVTALRLIELSDRTSAVMRSMLNVEGGALDPLLGLFKTFGAMFGVDVRCALEVVTASQWGETVGEYAVDSEGGSEGMILLGWINPRTVSVSSAADTEEKEKEKALVIPPTTSAITNPFEAFFRSPSHASNLASIDVSGSVFHSHFIRSVFAKGVDVAIFVDQQQHQHQEGACSVFLPFFGGPDDRLALELVGTMCRARGEVKGTVVWYHRSPEEEGGEGAGTTVASVGRNEMSALSISAFPDTIYNATSTATRLQSQTADQIAWDSFSADPRHRASITLVKTSTINPLHALLQTATASASLVVVGRSRRMAAESHHKELKKLLEEHGAGSGGEVRKTLGEVGTALIVSGVKTDLIVVQAGRSGGGSE